MLDNMSNAPMRYNKSTATGSTVRYCDQALEALDTMIISQKNNNRISGVYEIVNTINGHRYIGSSCNIQHRWKGHLLALVRGKHHSLYLQRSWAMWGEICFELSVLETCDRSRLAEREQFYIDTLKPEYNACPVAYSCFGLIRSQETREKLSISHKGKKQSPELIAKRTAGLKGHPYWGARKQSPETISKRTASLKGRKVTQEVLDRAIERRKLHPIAPEVGRKISASKMGHSVTPEQRAKMSVAKLGTHRTSEDRAKISLAQTGVPRPHKGHVIDAETRHKISIANSGRAMSQEQKDKQSAARSGKKQTPENIAKRTIGIRAYWENRRCEKEKENE